MLQIGTRQSSISNIVTLSFILEDVEEDRDKQNEW